LHFSAKCLGTGVPALDFAVRGVDKCVESQSLGKWEVAGKTVVNGGPWPVSLPLMPLSATEIH